MAGPSNQSKHNWEKPGEGTVKINFDGTIDHAASKASCGGIIRDHTGSWLGGFTNNLGYCSPVQAEVWALLRSIQLATQMGFKKVIFEGDSCEVINGMASDPVSNQVVCNILRACRKEARSIESWSMVAVTREVNKAADHLARMSARFSRGMHIKVDPPEELLILLEDDGAAIPIDDLCTVITSLYFYYGFPPSN